MEKHLKSPSGDTQVKWYEYFVKYRVGAKTDGLVVESLTAKLALESAGKMIGSEYELVDVRRL